MDGMSTTLAMIASATIGVVTIATTLGYAAWSRDRTLLGRLTQFVSPYINAPDASDLDSRFERAMSAFPFTSGLMRDLSQLSSWARPGRLVIYGLVLAGAAFLAAGFYKDSTRFAAGAFVGTLFAEVLLMQWQARKRWEKFRLQLPEALHVISSALAAGASLNQALGHASREVVGPLKAELTRVVEDVEVGKTLEEGLEDLKRRVPLPEFDMIIASLLIQQRSGGNLAALLNETAELLKEDQRLRREMEVLTSQARASAQLIGFLPIGLFLYLYFFNPSYIAPMVSTQLGMTALVVGLVLEMIGFGVVYRIATYNEYTE
jgi:Flp pilus assembly protein TadB